jgi:hypothetical protein
MLKSRAARPPDLATSYWLIEKHEAGRMEVPTVNLESGEEALPVFSWAEEARMFLDLGGFEEGGWAIRESTAGRLVSMLEEDLRAEVEFVALDPMPEMATPMFGTMIYLVTLDRQSFIDGYIDKEEPLGRRLE